MAAGHKHTHNTPHYTERLELNPYNGHYKKADGQFDEGAESSLEEIISTTSKSTQGYAKKHLAKNGVHPDLTALLKKGSAELQPWNEKSAEAVREILVKTAAIGSPNTMKRMLQALPPGDIVNAIIGTPENPAPVLQEIAREKLNIILSFIFALEKFFEFIRERRKRMKLAYGIDYAELLLLDEEWKKIFASGPLRKNEKKTLREILEQYNFLPHERLEQIHYNYMDSLNTALRERRET